MKILLVSWFFPPANTMGALRIGKLAKYLLARGHDVRVVCSRDLPFAQTLPLDIPEDRVHYTAWSDVNGFPKRVAQLRRAFRASPPKPAGAAPVSPPAPGAPASSPAPAGRLRGLRNAYMAATNIPDSQVGWYPHAVRGGRAAARDWRPDVIFASAPPHTTLLAGRRLAKLLGVPWVAEYRDRWVEDPYRMRPPWRQRFDRWLEDRILRSARAIVTVSEPWADDYRRRWQKPVRVVYNGFDPDDFPAEFDRAPTDPDTLEIVYTGVLYGTRRDPTPLFQAMASMGASAEAVRVRFYGADAETVRRLSAAHGVGHRVEACASVPYRDAIRVQQNADVLLLMQWNDPKEQGNCPGKLFEYIGVRRPVLGFGLADGVPARILESTGAGSVTNDPDAIAERLRGWIAEKKQHGEIPLLPESVRDGFSRWEQYADLEDFLAEAAATTAEPGR